MSSVVACTLYEGHHVHGVPALVNSLHRCGYRGLFVVGYRGPLPKWAHDVPGEELEIDGLSIVFTPVPETPVTVALYKPWLMRRVLDDLAPNCAGVVFIDADIVSLAPWKFFVKWIVNAIVVATDYSFPNIPSGHPWRNEWIYFLRDCGYEPIDRSFYCMSGFIGVPRTSRVLIDNWWHLTKKFITRSPEIANKFKHVDRINNAFAGTDQDLLAAAMMASDVAIEPTGKELLGFGGAAHYLVHPTGEKPWRRNYLGDWLLQGRLPTTYDRLYWASLDAPIRCRGRWRAYLVRAIRFFGRFYASR